MNKRITGTVSYHELEGGFWGIDTGVEKYLPINLPEQLKNNNSRISCSITVLEDMMTLHNWGEPCSIFSFSTLNE